ncbi:MAG: glycoside hydrolase family 32 protein [Ruminococcaceae bacterium]|nr:glycoside hydrolase family 32 protein [Oscillospiraceae bacterium]
MHDMAYVVECTRTFREKLLADRYRPYYHFAVPEDVGIPGDPNGAFYANGRYHLMYLYNRTEAGRSEKSNFCWGHISSTDLVHWRHHPDAIRPGDGDGGCFSGGAFVDDDGTAYISYWALPAGSDSPRGSGIGIARSTDRHYETWEKIATIDCTERGILVQRDPAGDLQFLGNADPSNIWKKDGVYYLQAGNLPVLNKYGRGEDTPSWYRGDWVDLFRSTDLRNWEYVHRFYQRRSDNSWTDESEDDMCPSFLPLATEDGSESGKYCTLFQNTWAIQPATTRSETAFWRKMES